MRFLSYIIILIILVFGVSFAVLNASTVTLNYYVGHYSLPLSLLLALTFALGCIFGIFAGLMVLFRLKSYNLRLKHQNTLLEKELANLRAMPLQDNR